MISEKEYTDFKNHDFEKGGISIIAESVIQKLQEKVEALEEELKEYKKKLEDHKYMHKSQDSYSYNC